MPPSCKMPSYHATAEVGEDIQDAAQLSVKLFVGEGGDGGGNGRVLARHKSVALDDVPEDGGTRLCEAMFESLAPDCPR